MMHFYILKDEIKDIRSAFMDTISFFKEKFNNCQLSYSILIIEKCWAKTYVWKCGKNV